MSNVAEGLDTEIRDGVLILTLNRSEVRNALDGVTSHAVDRVLNEAIDDASVGAVVLTGAGDHAFCAGMDLKSAARSGVKVMVADRGFCGLTERGFYPKPLIAAVNGAAFAGGFELVLACDLVVAADTARFALSEIKRGMAPGSGLVELARRLPRVIALELLLTGVAIDAERAAVLGLVNRVVPRARVVDEAVALAAELIQHAPLPLRHIKRMVDEVPTLPLDGVYRRLYESAKEYTRSEDMREGLAAFAEGRPPVWRGR